MIIAKMRSGHVPNEVLSCVNGNSWFSCKCKNVRQQVPQTAGGPGYRFAAQTGSSLRNFNAYPSLCQASPSGWRWAFYTLRIFIRSCAVALSRGTQREDEVNP